MPDDLKLRGLSLIVVEVSLLITLNILSLIGTTLVCISICKNNRLRTTTNLFIMVLAVSNLLSAVFVMPISASVLIAGKLDLRQNALPTLRPLQPLCYLRFSCNHGLKSCKSLCEDMQVGSAVQETVFSEKVARYDCLRVEFHCMLHGGSSIVWSSSVRIVSGYAQRSIVHLSETGKFIHYGIAITLLFLTPLVATTQKVAKMIRQHNVFAITTIQRRESARERSRKWRKSKGIVNHEIKLSKSLLISSRLRLHDLLGTVLDDRHSPSLFVFSSKRWALFYVSPLVVECSQPFHLCWDESCIPL